MYQYRANVEFDIDGLKDFYIDDLMEQELNIYLMVECWIRDYIDINDKYNTFSYYFQRIAQSKKFVKKKRNSP